MGRGVYIAYCIYHLCLLAGRSGQLERAASTEEKTNLARIVNFVIFFKVDNVNYMQSI